MKKPLSDCALVYTSRRTGIGFRARTRVTEKRFEQIEGKRKEDGIATALFSFLD